MKNLLPVAALLALCVLVVFSFGRDSWNVSHGGSIDLRNRITGARVLLERGDAWHYKWKPGAPPEWCDPFNNPALPISKVTVTPSLLAWHFPLAVLPYGAVQQAWLITEWLLLAGIAVLWARLLPSPRARWLWVFAVVAFTWTAAWRHHVDKGQAYILIAFLLSLWLTLTKDRELGNSAWSGIAAGLLVAVRPPLVLLAGPFILLRRRGQVWGALGGLALGAGLPLLWRPSCWAEYHAAMTTWAELYTSGTANPRPPPQAFPAVIEGLPLDVLAGFARIPFADSSVFALLRACGLTGVPGAAGGAALIALVVLWFWKARRQSADVLLAGLAAWAFLLDLFLPAFRYNYNDVLILVPAAATVLLCGRGAGLVRLLLAGAWLTGIAVHTWQPAQTGIIQLPTLLMFAAAVAVLLLPAKAKPMAPA